MRTKKALQALLLASLAAATPGGGRADETTVFSIGSGDLDGVYYSVARATCRIFNARSTGDLRCSPEPTDGSIYNLVMLGEGELEFALAQSDWQRAAYEGEGPFAAAGSATWLRSVASLYPEPITIVARNDPELRRATDLAGRRVDIGAIGSGRASTVRAMLRRMEMETSYFGKLTNYDPRRAVEEICEGRLDAAIFVVGHPSEIVRDAVERCGARLLPFDGRLARRMADQYADYSWVEIPGGVYEGRPVPVATLAVYATLVTRADVDAALVEQLAEALLEAREALADAVPQISELELMEARAKGLSAPRHQGVARFSLP